MEIEFKTHKETSPSELQAICLLKDESWPYGLGKQMDWIKKNINQEDIHVLGYKDGKLVAYVNLVWRKLELDGEVKEALGIGNVCVANAIKGQGLGGDLVKHVNDYLDNNNFVGILLCKSALVNFYSKYQWLVCEQEVVSDFNIDNIHVMVYNVPELHNKIRIEGSSF